MHQKTKQLLEKVDAAHDWDRGQTYGGSGTRLSQTDDCRICGLQRHWFSDAQNGVEDRYSFTGADGESIPLREAAGLRCVDDGEHGAVSLPLLTFQACAAIGLASGVWAVYLRLVAQIGGLGL